MSRPRPEAESGALEEAVRQVPRSYRDILAIEVAQGLGELERPARGLLISGLSAGLEIGFSVLLMGVITTLAADSLPELLTRLLTANMYAVGFIFVILGRSELFTEHTTLAVFPVLEGRATVGRLARLWGLVYAANVTGAAAFAFLLTGVAPQLGVVEPEAFGRIAHTLVEHEGGTIFLSAVLAGWLMGLLSWLVSAGRDTTSQIFFVWLVTASIGLGHLHHCIVGTTEVLAGLFAGQAIGWAAYGHFLLWTTLGNAVGGVVFVALLKYGHVIEPGSEPRPIPPGE